MNKYNQKLDEDIEINSTISRVTKSLYSSILLMLIFICCFVLFYFMQSEIKHRVLQNLINADVIYLVLSCLWIIIRLGWAEKIILRSKNMAFARSKTLMTQEEMKKRKITITELRAERAAKSWIGLFISLGVSLFLMIVCLIILYTR